MKHKGLIMGVAFGLAAIVFLLFWLASLWLHFSLWVAAFFALLVFMLGIILPGRAYWRGTYVLNNISRQYRYEQILYADIASLMDERNERTGALVVTRSHLVFRTPVDLRGRHWQLEYALQDIALAQNRRDHLLLTAGGKTHRFKVFQCDYLVKTISDSLRAFAQQNAATADEAPADAQHPPAAHSQSPQSEDQHDTVGP